MAFNQTVVGNNALSQEYIHDFASSSLDIPFTISLGFEAFLSSSMSVFSGELITDAKYYGGPGMAGMVSTTEGYGILIDSKGDGTGMQVNIPGWPVSQWGSGKGLTKTNFNLYGAPAGTVGNLAGPYNLNYTTAGAKTVKIILYRRYMNNWSGSTMNPFYGQIPYAAPFPQVMAAGVVEFPFNLYQRSVSISKRNSVSGLELADGTSINDMTTDPAGVNTIILNKTNNRGDDTTSLWTVLKQDSNGVFVAATALGDYQIGAGTLSDDEITLVWLTSGNYRITNTSIGLGTNNSDVNVVNFNVGQTVIDTITLPKINTITSSVVAYNNTEVGTNPLTGITTFQFTVSAEIDISVTSWVQKIGNVTTTLTIDEAQWLSELTSRCDIKCKVKQGNTVLETRIGLGPHTFTKSEGNYTAGYEVTPKAGGLIVQTLSGEFQITELDNTPKAP